MTKDSAFAGNSPANGSDIVQDAVDVVRQGLGLLVDLDDRTYARVQASPFGASIGQHYRHVVEHFQCLVRGISAKEINYDARERNVRLQTEVGYASVASCQLLVDLKRLTEETLEGECAVITSSSYGSTCPLRLRSNGRRELAYCVGHAIHHYAIMKILCGNIGVSVPEAFGYAPSTLKHLTSSAAD